jgi:hypothetical protein
MASPSSASTAATVTGNEERSVLETISNTLEIFRLEWQDGSLQALQSALVLAVRGRR